MIPNLLFSGSAHSSFACDQCKKKKVKCDKNAPVCGHCERHNRSCNYPHSVSRPGPKAGTTRRRRRSSADAITDVEQDGCAQQVNAQSSNVEKQYERTIEIIHPHHHSPLSLSQQEKQTNGRGMQLDEALRALQITNEQCQKNICTYFSNMTSFSLFHQPTFTEKLSAINSSKEIQALLVSMAAFSCHFDDCGIPAMDQGIELWEWAHGLVRDRLDDVADEAPPLGLLQALLLVTWQKTYQGVRGIAFRLIGQCIRLAYEMKLNVEQECSSDSEWIQQEERRRAWWMCWELDIFASTIRHLPTAIDWKSNSTLLPSQDSSWFAGVKVPSCVLEVDMNERWKAIQLTDNRSWTAWFAVINSYKYDAYLLSMPTVATEKSSDLTRRKKRTSLTPGSLSVSSPQSQSFSASLEPEKRREVLMNCLHCLLTGMPKELTVDDAFLSFSPATRHIDHGRYAIHLLLQVTQFFLFRQDIFRALPTRARQLIRKTPESSEVESSDFSPATSASRATNNESRQSVHQRSSAWKQFLATAEDASMLIRNSPRHHIRYVNPCLSNAIWFAASALIIGRLLGSRQTDADRDWMTSNFDLLCTTLGQYVKIWNVPATLVERFSTLEDYISSLGRPKDDLQSTGQFQRMQYTTALEMPFAKKGRVDREDILLPGGDTPGPAISSQTRARGLPESRKVPILSEALPKSLHTLNQTSELSQHVPTPASSDLGSMLNDVDNQSAAGRTLNSGSANAHKIACDINHDFDIMQDIDVSDLLYISGDNGLGFDFFRCPFE